MQLITTAIKADTTIICRIGATVSFFINITINSLITITIIIHYHFIIRLNSVFFHYTYVCLALISLYSVAYSLLPGLLLLSLLRKRRPVSLTLHKQCKMTSQGGDGNKRRCQNEELPSPPPPPVLREAGYG